MGPSVLEQGMRPVGWFQIGWSEQWAAGEVRPLRYFGTELVSWRDEAARLHVQDAYCRHLGAHLGYGGTVLDGCLACPFHGWRWDGEGRNTHIPFRDRPNRAQRLPVGPVAERNGVACIWHDSSGSPPWFDVPDIFTDVLREEGAGPEDFYRPWPTGARFYSGLRILPQFVTENSVDVEHFAFVHGNAEVPTLLEQHDDEATFRTRVGFSSRRGGWGAELDVLLAGVGLAMTGFRAKEGNRLMLGTTPVDDTTCDLFQTAYLPRRNGDRSVGIPPELDDYRDRATGGLADDIVIWEHQWYVDPPGLAADEVRGFLTLRRWTERFYRSGASVAG